MCPVPTGTARSAAPSQGSKTVSPRRSAGWAAGRDPPLPTPTAQVWCKAQLCRAPPEHPSGPGQGVGSVRLRRKGVCACEPVGR